MARQEGVPVRMRAADGTVLGGFVWRHGGRGPSRPIVVVAPATSVRCRYYARFAAYLFANDHDVVLFDYRGIGESRPPRLRGFGADWLDWGEQDLEAALGYAAATFPGQPMHLVGHSIGGFAIGLAPSNGKLARVLTVGAQYAYWRDYAAPQRHHMYVKWHLLMPAITRLFGYCPARRLGWMEDTPAGVVRDWSRMKARFEDSLGPHHRRGDAGALLRRFAHVTAPILAIGLEDDPYGTPEALDRLLAYYQASPRRHWRIAPAEIGAEAIGHFAFFHDRFRDSLWPVALAWLRAGEIPAGAPGRAWPPAPPRA
ncbi:alpha/beta hydrolase family protein [Roseococcus microcysteis]|uniref:alpha/beta hydrolase family protein n=1 Tax=Roseococcus microcysteis TaxID=2771361 RepID=UPI001CC77C33|nr:alpha/beta fold hydrolase [Roseococcus microcysteis]